MRQTKASASSTLKAQSIDDLGAPVEVRRHPGARRLTLRVSRTRRAVIVTLPVQCDLGRSGLLPPSQHCLGARAPRQPAGAGALPRRRFHAATRRAASRRVRRAQCRHAPRSKDKVRGTVRCCARAEYPELQVIGAPEHAPRRLREWLCAEAMRDLDQRVAWHAARLRLKPKRIAVRDQSSRWGSCSTTGVLSFSWRLILAPLTNPRLRRRPRGRAPEGDESRAAFLGAREGDHAGHGRGQALASDLRHGSPPLRHQRQRPRRLSLTT